MRLAGVPSRVRDSGRPSDFTVRRLLPEGTDFPSRVRIPVTSSPPDDRSPLAQALAWSSRITTISAEMVLPAVLGHWLDRYLGTWVVFVALGAMLGMFVGLLHLLQMTRPGSGNAAGTDSSSERDLKSD